MSKKTFFKRIALTAIAALGIGMLSLAPTQAAVTSHTLTIDSATDSTTVGDSATATLTSNWVNLGGLYDSVSIYAVITSSNASTAGQLSFAIADSYTSTANTGAEFNSPVYFHGNSDVGDTSTALVQAFPRSTFGTSAAYAATRDSLTIVPSLSTVRNQGTVITMRLYGVQAAGTYTVSVYTQKSDGGAAYVVDTPSLTWTVTVTEPTRAASSASTATLRTGDAQSFWFDNTYHGGTAEAVDSATVAGATASLTDVTSEFSLVVKQKLGAGVNTARESYTVTVAGEAFVTAGTDADGNFVTPSARPITTSGGNKSVRMAVATADSPTLVRIWSTGTAGTATVTVTTDSGLTIATKTLTFHGTIAGLSVVQVYKNVIRSGVTTGSTSVVAIKAVDSGDRGVTGVSIAGVSSNTAAIASGSCTDAITYAGVATDASTADGTYYCDLTQAPGSTSGSASTITWRALKYLSTTEYWTVDQNVTMGGAAATFTITTNKENYEPGEAMTVTVTAKDASGNTPYDLSAGPSITVNKATGGSTLSMSSYIGGVSTSNSRDDDGTILDANNLFAPAASGKFILTAIDGNDATVTATATVSDDAATAAAAAASDAALEAIDAANAATDAANLAAEAADAATVAAEEARDAADAATAAVEALSGDINGLVAALKAQITTLAKTVAKIAKKVKA